MKIMALTTVEYLYIAVGLPTQYSRDYFLLKFSLPTASMASMSISHGSGLARAHFLLFLSDLNHFCGLDTNNILMATKFLEARLDFCISNSRIRLLTLHFHLDAL